MSDRDLPYRRTKIRRPENVKEYVKINRDKKDSGKIFFMADHWRMSITEDEARRFAEDILAIVNNQPEEE